MFGRLLQRLRRRRPSERPHAAKASPTAANRRPEARKGLGGFVEWILGGGARPKK